MYCVIIVIATTYVIITLCNSDRKSKNYISDMFYLRDYYAFFFKTFKNKMNQAKRSNKPPIGVTKPITLKSKATKLVIASKYIEPENKIIPDIVRYKIIFLVFSAIRFVVPMKSKKRA